MKAELDKLIETILATLVTDDIVEQSELTPEESLLITDDQESELVISIEDATKAALDDTIDRSPAENPTTKTADGKTGEYKSTTLFFVKSMIRKGIDRIHGANIARQIHDDDRDDAIEKAVAMNKIHAQFVAESEIFATRANYSADLNPENGFDYYIYRTSADEVVRPKHNSRNGKVFKYGTDQRTPDDTPLFAPRCRCHESPIDRAEAYELDNFYYPQDDSETNSTAQNDQVILNNMNQQIVNTLKTTTSIIKSESGSILVDGYIDDWDGNSFSQIRRNILYSLSADDDIQFDVTSHGGYSWEGLALYSWLRSISNKVTVNVFGYAGSAASMLIAASDEAIAGNSDGILIHNSNLCLCGNAIELKSAIDNMETVDQLYVNAYVEKTGREEAEVIELMSKDTYITSHDAYEFGLIDTIREDSPRSITARENVINDNGNDNDNGNEGIQGEDMGMKEDLATANSEVAKLTSELAVEKSKVSALESNKPDEKAIYAKALVEIKSAQDALIATESAVKDAGFKVNGDTEKDILSNAIIEAGGTIAGLDTVESLGAVFNSIKDYVAKTELTSLSDDLNGQSSNDGIVDVSSLIAKNRGVA